MVIEVLECNYQCGTPFTLAFHYKIKLRDKISGCACGCESLSGICIKDIASPIGQAGVHSHKTNCSSSGFKSDSISSSSFHSNSNSISSSISNSSSSSCSNSDSNPKPYPEPNPKPNPTHTNVKLDITNKVFNKCNVIKQMTSFDKKKSCEECNPKKNNCEKWPSIISFSGLRSHI